ncbi:MAG: hypothetical protein IPI67_13620 [Myxococcales bacterium]|nr:hypothetical protein [Myxococcales bacterium]
MAFVMVATSMRIAVRIRQLLGSQSWRTGYLVRMGPINSRELLDKELYRVADYNPDADRQVALEVEWRTAPGTKISSGVSSRASIDVGPAGLDPLHLRRATASVVGRERACAS